MKKNYLYVLLIVAFSYVSLFSIVYADGDIPKVVYYVNGELGDKSFFDSANRGLEQAISELGIVGKTVEGGYDQAFWEPDIQQLSEGDWDIISGSQNA